MGTQRVGRPRAWDFRGFPRTTAGLGSEDHPDCCGEGKEREAGNREAPGWLQQIKTETEVKRKRGSQGHGWLINQHPSGFRLGTTTLSSWERAACGLPEPYAWPLQGAVVLCWGAKFLGVTLRNRGQDACQLHCLVPGTEHVLTGCWLLLLLLFVLRSHRSCGSSLSSACLLDRALIHLCKSGDLNGSSWANSLADLPQMLYFTFGFQYP